MTTTASFSPVRAFQTFDAAVRRETPVVNTRLDGAVEVASNAIAIGLPGWGSILNLAMGGHASIFSSGGLRQVATGALQTLTVGALSLFMPHDALLVMGASAVIAIPSITAGVIKMLAPNHYFSA